MAKNLITESKAWLPNFYVNGKWVENPVVRFNGRIMEEEIVKFMGDFFKFLLESEFMNKCAKIWLTSNLASVRTAFEFYNSQCDSVDRINIKTAQSEINYAKNRLHSYFEPDLFLNIMANPNKYLNESLKVLDKLYREYFNDKEYKQATVLKLPKDKVNRKLASEDWMRFVNLMKRYSLKMIKTIESGESEIMSREMIGYYNFLISNKRLTKEDKARLTELRSVLGLE